MRTISKPSKTNRKHMSNSSKCRNSSKCNITLITIMLLLQITQVCTQHYRAKPLTKSPNNSSSNSSSNNSYKVSNKMPPKVAVVIIISRSCSIFSWEIWIQIRWSNSMTCLSSMWRSRNPTHSPVWGTFPHPTRRLYSKMNTSSRWLWLHLLMGRGIHWIQLNTKETARCFMNTCFIAENLNNLKELLSPILKIQLLCRIWLKMEYQSWILTN